MSLELEKDIEKNVDFQGKQCIMYLQHIFIMRSQNLKIIS